MKTSSGKPYVKPTTRPTFKFSNGQILVEAFETYHNVEVYQINNGHEQRIVMSSGDFDNFYNRLLSCGFSKQT